MPKPVALTPELVETPQTTPQAATSPRSTAKPTSPPKAEQVPLQLRLPREEVRAIKIAAAQQEETISDFMLACFHAYIQSRKHA